MMLRDHLYDQNLIGNKTGVGLKEKKLEIVAFFVWIVR